MDNDVDYALEMGGPTYSEYDPTGTGDYFGPTTGNSSHPHMADGREFFDPAQIVADLNNASANKEFGKLSFVDRFMEAFKSYNSMPKEASIALGAIGMPVLPAMALAALGAALTGNLNSTNGVPSNSESQAELIRAGQEYAKANNIDVKDLAKNTSYTVFQEKIQAAPSDRKVIEAYRYLKDNPNEEMEKALAERSPGTTREEMLGALAAGLSQRVFKGKTALADTPEKNDYKGLIQLGFRVNEGSGGMAPIMPKDYVRNLDTLSGLSDEDLEKLSIQNRLGKSLYSETPADFNGLIAGAAGLGAGITVADFMNGTKQGSQTTGNAPAALGTTVASTSSLGAVADAKVDTSLWGTFLDRAMKELEPTIRQNVDFMAREATKYGNDIKASNDKNNALLSSLTDQMNTNTGIFTPTQTDIGSYTPGTSYIKSRALQGLDNKRQLNDTNTATTIYGTAGERSPGKANLATLAALEALTSKDKGFTNTDKEMALKKYIAELDASTSTTNIAEGRKSSTLTDITNTVQAGKSIYDFGKVLSLWGA